MASSRPPTAAALGRSAEQPPPKQDVPSLPLRDIQRLSSQGAEPGKAAEWQTARTTVSLDVDDLACAPPASPALAVATMLESICCMHGRPVCGLTIVPLGVVPMSMPLPVPLALVALVAPLYLDGSRETLTGQPLDRASLGATAPTSAPVVSPVPTSSARPDGTHSWRKYGQKNVFGVRFPVEYYRCVFQPCPARKRVTGGFTFFIGSHSDHPLSDRKMRSALR